MHVTSGVRVAVSTVARASVALAACAVIASVAQAQVVGVIGGFGTATVSQGGGGSVVLGMTGPVTATLPITGVFASIASGNTGPIQNVVVVPNAQGVPSFIVIRDFDFALMAIAPGAYSSSGCSITTPAAGQSCTPAGTALNLVNTANGFDLSFAGTGVLTTPASHEYNFMLTFTSHSSQTSYQQLLTTMSAGESVPIPYTLEIGLTSAVVPEPSTLALLGTGMCALASVRIRRRGTGSLSAS